MTLLCLLSFVLLSETFNLNSNNNNTNNDTYYYDGYFSLFDGKGYIKLFKNYFYIEFYLNNYYNIGFNLINNININNDNNNDIPLTIFNSNTNNAFDSYIYNNNILSLNETNNSTYFIQCDNQYCLGSPIININYQQNYIKLYVS